MRRLLLLRRDVINKTHNVQQDGQDGRNEVCQDWSDFNFPDMYGDKMDLYEADLCAHNDATDCPLSEEDNVSVLSQDTDKFDFIPPPHNHPPLMFTCDQK